MIKKNMAIMVLLYTSTNMFGMGWAFREGDSARDLDPVNRAVRERLAKKRAERAAEQQAKEAQARLKWVMEAVELRELQAEDSQPARHARKPSDGTGNAMFALHEGWE